MIERQIHKKEMIYCPRYGFDSLHPIDICSTCPFQDGFNDDKVKCMYDRSMMIPHVRVTEFEDSDKVRYRLRVATDEMKKEYCEKNGITDQENVESCDLCAFGKTLKNGKFVCLLKQSIENSDEISAFCAYKDEFFERVVD